MLTIPITLVWSETLMLTTQIHESEGDPPFEEKIRIENLESGVMDVLFDNGHIFFNTYSYTAKDQNSTKEDNLAIARQTGVDYMVQLIPVTLGVNWFIYPMNRTGTEQENALYLEQVDQTLNNRKKWHALGKVLGQQIVDSIESDQ